MTCGGQEIVSEGSTSAHLGIMRRVAMPTFMKRFGSVTTATGLTSEPVPDVVGMQTMSISGPGHGVLAVVLRQRAAVLEQDRACTCRDPYCCRRRRRS